MTLHENLSWLVALLVSALLHALAFGSYRQMTWRWPSVRRMTPAAPVITFVQVDEPPAALIPPPTPAPKNEPREFVETDARQVTGDQPANTKLYSDNATVAANPENPTGKLGDTPYVAGKETHGHSTENVPLPGPAAMPAAPSAPGTALNLRQPLTPPSPPRGEGIANPSPLPAGGEDQGEGAARLDQTIKTAQLGTRVVEPAPQQMAMAEQPAVPAVPAVPASPAMATAPPAAPAVSSPREIVARKAALTATGVARTGVAAFNVAASPFGEYDKKVVRAVQSRWFALIDRNDIYERTGAVALHFELYADGSVRALRRGENTAGEILALFCEKAILESAPFEAFPAALRVLVGDEPRAVDFTFYY